MQREMKLFLYNVRNKNKTLLSFDTLIRPTTYRNVVLLCFCVKRKSLETHRL